MKIPYSQLQTYFADTLQSPADVANTFTFGAFEIESIDEVSNDTIIDVKVLPNRAHDCLSFIGVAREYAVLSGKQMKADVFTDAAPTYPEKGAMISLLTDDTSLVPVHTLSLIKGVKVGPSPDWLVSILEKCGQRSINNVVDATNFVMLAYGQPTHAFDAQKLSENTGTRGIRIRKAANGETMSILGGKSYTLDDSMLVLADINTNDVLDIAGVKGGLKAELTNETVDIVVSAAKFDPTSIRKTAQKLSLRTDASKRFENEIPFRLPFYGQKYVQELIAELTGGTIIETIAVHADEPEARHVSTTVAMVQGVLGEQISESEITRILTSLHLNPIVSNGIIEITPAWWRPDMIIPEDIVEEVGRVYGYDKIPATPLPEGRTVPENNSLIHAADAIRNVLTQNGYLEIRTYSLVPDGAVVLANALNADKGALRGKLAANMHEALKQNEYHAPSVGNFDCIKLFEIGHIFSKTSEVTHMCIGVHPLSGKKREERANAQLLIAKDLIQKALDVTIDQHIDASTLEFDLELAIKGKEIPPQPLMITTTERYKPLSLFPTALRDIAFWTPEGDFADPTPFKEIIVANAGAFLERCDIFDRFEKAGKHSFAFHLVFQSYDKTLTEEDLNPTMKKITDALTNKGCTVR
jgi:phenylalanyl-tRNA synthetase beta chain